MADIGDDALAAGMDILDGTDDRRDGWEEINKTRDYIAQRTNAVQPVAKGGTGATTAAGARSNLGITASNVPTATATVQADIDYLATLVAAANTNANNRRPYTDGNFDDVQIYVPDAYAASSGYTVAYINGDGRLSKGASSARYKRDIDRDPTLPDVFAVPLASFTMKDDPDGITRYGYIAEDLDENPETAVFVVYDAQGRPDSFDMIGLLLAQVAQLHARVTELEAGRDA